MTRIRLRMSRQSASFQGQCTHDSQASNLLPAGYPATAWKDEIPAAWIDEIGEESSDEALRRLAREKQHDGPPISSLTVVRWMPIVTITASLSTGVPSGTEATVRLSLSPNQRRSGAMKMYGSAAVS